MSFSGHRRDWEDLAELDPMWAVLSEPQRQFGRWNAAEFFSTGEDEVAELRVRLSDLGLPDTFGSALDFGCGLGRITRALRVCCSEVVGVDVSEGMIRQAQAYTPTCDFVHNPHNDLRMFLSNRFDLVFSRRVLQHQRSDKLITSYVAELVRVMKVGGLAIFQIPCHISFLHRLQPRRRIYELLRPMGIRAKSLYGWGFFPICMTSVPEKDVTYAVQGAGGRVLAVEADESGRGFNSKLYYATK